MVLEPLLSPKLRTENCHGFLPVNKRRDGRRRRNRQGRRLARARTTTRRDDDTTAARLGGWQHREPIRAVSWPCMADVSNRERAPHAFERRVRRVVASLCEPKAPP